MDNIRTIGTAYADASVREIGISQFAETDLFSNLEACGFPWVRSLDSPLSIESNHTTRREGVSHSYRREGRGL
jgi:hypothetical protein